MSLCFITFHLLSGEITGSVAGEMDEIVRVLSPAAIYSLTALMQSVPKCNILPKDLFPSLCFKMGDLEKRGKCLSTGNRCGK